MQVADSGLLRLLSLLVEAVAVVDGQSVQDPFSTVDLAGQVLPILLPGDRHEVKHFHRGLLGREVAPVTHCPQIRQNLRHDNE